MGWLRSTWAVAAHDVAAEARRPVATWGVLCFGASSLVILRLALAGGGQLDDGVLAGALWIVLVYGALLGTGRVLAAEREAGGWDALVAAPCDRSAIYAGKALAAALLALALHAMLVPLYLVLFAAPPVTLDGLGLLVAAVALADLGFGAVGVLVAAISLRSSSRELLGAAAFLPLAIPLVLVAVTATLAAYGVSPDAPPALATLGFLAGYDAVFALAGVAIFPALAVE